MSSFYASSRDGHITAATFVPTSSPFRLQTTRTAVAPRQNGLREWRSGNLPHTASVKVDLGMTPIKNNLVAVTENGTPVGNFRLLCHNHGNLDVLIRDYRGLAKDLKDHGEFVFGQTKLNDRRVNPRDIYHQRLGLSPGYDLINTDYEQKGWINGRVYYYGVRASVVRDRRFDHDAEISGWFAPITLSVSHTPSALTPNRAVRIQRHDKEFFQLPHSDIIEFVEQGKVVMMITQRHYDTETKRQFQSEWMKEVKHTSIMVMKSWRETTKSIPTTDWVGEATGPRFSAVDDGVLLTDISSKNIVDTPMNPFGEGSIAKNRISLGDGLFYITETADVPQFAIETAKRNYLFKKELMEAVLHPDRVAKMVEKYGIDWVDV